MRLEDRVIAKTINGQYIVRPLADKYINHSVEVGEISYRLSDEGIRAWNNGFPWETIQDKYVLYGSVDGLKHKMVGEPKD